MAASDRNLSENESMFRCTGALTIGRAGSTQRELDEMPDGMTIDLAGVERMDTVGAWLIHRTQRDRGARRHLVRGRCKRSEPSGESIGDNA